MGDKELIRETGDRGRETRNRDIGWEPKYNTYMREGTKDVR